MLGLLRLVHPFPIVVDAVATVAIALVAGAPLVLAARLGASMLALQAAIGALNDVVDAPRDAGRKPGKPIPAGFVSPRFGRLVAAGSGVVGLLLAALSGAPTLAVAAAILAVGAVYDLALKGTPWSWLPFAVGIPLLPVFAWLGTGQPLPPSFAALIPAAGLAGAALAIGNALVDVERDRAAGVTSIAAHLGPMRAWRVMAALYTAVIGTAAVTSMTATSAIVGLAASLVPGAIVLAGVAWSTAREPVVRERGWRLQAAGVALLAAGWLSALLLG